MNILLLSEHGFSLGGAELYAQIIYQELRRFGISVIKASIRGYGYDIKLESSTSAFRRFYDFKFSKSIKDVIIKSKIDLVYVNLLHAPFAFNFHRIIAHRKIPYIIAVHDWEYVCPTSYRVMLPEMKPCNLRGISWHCLRCIYHDTKSIVQPLLRVSYNWYVFNKYLKDALLILVPNEEYADILRDKGYNAIYKPLPYDYSSLKPTPGGDGSVCFVGRMIWYKGLNVINYVARHMPDTTFHVMGFGSTYKPESPNINYHGAVSDEEKFRILSMCSVVIIPSIWAEVSPYVAYEAFALAKPVVAFDHGGQGEIARKAKAGLLARPYDYNDFLDKVRQLLSDEGLARELGLNGRRWLEENANPTKYVADLLNILRSYGLT